MRSINRTLYCIYALIRKNNFTNKVEIHSPNKYLSLTGLLKQIIIINQINFIYALPYMHIFYSSSQLGKNILDSCASKVFY